MKSKVVFSLVAFLLLVGCIAPKTQTGQRVLLRLARLSNPQNLPVLSMEAVWITNQAFPDWSQLIVSYTNSEEGTGSFPMVCYSGPAVKLIVGNMGTNRFYLEAASDLFYSNWSAYPSPYLQRHFDTNDEQIFPVWDQRRFFRLVQR